MAQNSKEAVYAAIGRERDFQDAKWGGIDEHPHTVGEWLLVVEAELQEAKQAWVKGSGDTDALAELLQVAAVVVACLEQHQLVERLPAHTELAALFYAANRR